MVEAGLPGFDIVATSWFAAPRGTPMDIVHKLSRETLQALNDPEFRDKLRTMGIDPLGFTPEEAAAFLRSELPRWKAIVTDAGVKLE